MIGLESGTVRLCDHDVEWEIEAKRTVEELSEILGDVAVDIAHVGSTSIKSIKAKPIIDIAVAVNDFAAILALEDKLKERGYYYRPKTDMGEQLLFACGSRYDGTGRLQTHFIHVVKAGSMDWINYINFRDHLNANPDVAREYEALKVSLAADAPVDKGRKRYLAGKNDFIRYTLRKALVKSYLGRTVRIVMDRPIGTVHPKHEDIIYPINYGYIPNVYGGDGEELDVYLLGVNEPVEEYTARIIGIVHRQNDVEDKLVASPVCVIFTKEEIETIIHFQEQYYDSYVETL